MKQRVIALIVVSAQLLSFSSRGDESPEIPFAINFVDLSAQQQEYTQFSSGPQPDSDPAIELNWHWTLQSESDLASQPVPVPETKPSYVLFKVGPNSTDSTDREVTSKIKVTEPLPTFELGLGALEAILQDNAVLTSANCGCIVHYKGEGNKAHHIGQALTIGANHFMAEGLARNACVGTAVTDLKSHQPDWVALNSCKFAPESVDPKIRTIAKKALIEMKEKAAKKKSAESMAYTHKVVSTLLSGLMGGIFWRARGGGFVNMTSTAEKRLLFVGVGYALIGYLDGGVDGAIAGALMWPGSLMAYYGVDFAHIYNSKNANQADNHSVNVNMGDPAATAIMSAVGSLRTILPAAYLNYRGYDARPMGLSGWTMGPCYYMSERYLNSPRSPNSFLSSTFNGGTTFAESCFGIATSAGLALSLASGNGEMRKKLAAVSDFDGITGIVNETASQLAKAGKEDTIVEIIDMSSDITPLKDLQPVIGVNGLTVAKSPNTVKNLIAVCKGPNPSEPRQKDDFYFSRSGFNDFKKLTEKDAYVLAQFQRMTHDPRTSNYDISYAAFDVESLIANYFQQVCSTVGVVFTK